MRIPVSSVLSFLRDPIIPSLWAAPFQLQTPGSISHKLPGVRHQKLFTSSCGGGGCDHPRGSTTSRAGWRGSREELRPPFDAAKHPAALAGSLQPSCLQSSPGQSSAPSPRMREPAQSPGLSASCDKRGREQPAWGTDPEQPCAGQTCSPCPSQAPCSSPSPSPALWLLLPVWT